MKKQHPHPSPSPTHLPPRIKQVNLQSNKISSLIEWPSAQLHLSRCWGIWIIVELIVPSFDGHRRDHIQARTDHGPIPVGHAGIQTRVHELRAEEKTLKALAKWNLTRKEVKHPLSISACLNSLRELESNCQIFSPIFLHETWIQHNPNRKKNKKQNGRVRVARWIRCHDILGIVQPCRWWPWLHWRSNLAHLDVIWSPRFLLVNFTASEIGNFNSNSNLQYVTLLYLI